MNWNISRDWEFLARFPLLQHVRPGTSTIPAHGIRSGYWNNEWMDFTWRRNLNPGMYSQSPRRNGPVHGDTRLMHLWSSNPRTAEDFLHTGPNLLRRGTGSFCVCQSISARFERFARLHPLLIDTPTCTDRSPALYGTPPPIVEALRDVDTDPWWSLEASLLTRCGICATDEQEYAEQGINYHDVHVHIEFYRMENAILSDDWTTVLRCISRLKYTFNARDSNFFTPLHIAAMYNKECIAQHLLRGGAFVNAETCDGYTPLMIAIRGFHLSFIRLLLLYDANPNASTPKGITPLGLAVTYNHKSMINMLLKHGANPNGGYPIPHIHRSLWMASEDTTRLLIEAGASLSSKDLRGRLPMDMAFIHKRWEMFYYMLPKISGPHLLECWRRNHRAPEMLKEILRRIKILYTFVYEQLHVWNIPSDVENNILQYLFKYAPNI